MSSITQNEKLYFAIREIKNKLAKGIKVNYYSQEDLFVDTDHEGELFLNAYVTLNSAFYALAHSSYGNIPFPLIGMDLSIKIVEQN